MKLTHPTGQLRIKGEEKHKIYKTAFWRPSFLAYFLHDWGKGSMA